MEKNRAFEKGLRITLATIILCVGCGSSTNVSSDVSEGTVSEDTEKDSEETVEDAAKTESDTETGSGTEETEETEETSVISIHNTIESASQYKGTFAVGYDHVVGLLQNGTAISEETGKSEHDAGESDIGDWEDIIYVDAGSNVSVGLKDLNLMELSLLREDMTLEEWTGISTDTMSVSGKM